MELVTPSTYPISAAETFPIDVVDGRLTTPVNVGATLLALLFNCVWMALETPFTYPISVDVKVPTDVSAGSPTVPVNVGLASGALSARSAPRLVIDDCAMFVRVLLDPLMVFPVRVCDPVVPTTEPDTAARFVLASLTPASILDSRVERFT